MAKEFLKDNAFVIVTGVIMTVIAIGATRSARGDIAVGGELFILPLMLFVSGWIRMMIADGIFDSFIYDDEEDEDDDE